MKATADHGRWWRTLPAQGSDRGFGALQLEAPAPLRSSGLQRARPASAVGDLLREAQEGSRSLFSRFVTDRRPGRSYAPVHGLLQHHMPAVLAWSARMPHRRARALAGLAAARWKGGQNSGAEAVIRRALATENDYEALVLISAPGAGVHGFRPAMGSVVLAVCRPARFTVADSRALKALRVLDLMPLGPPSFRMQDWQPYLEACRELANSCDMRLRDVDRALWGAAADSGLPNPYGR